MSELGSDKMKVRYTVEYNGRNYEHPLHSNKRYFIRNIADVVNILEYCVTQDGDTLLHWSAMGLIAREAALDAGFQMKGTDRSSFNETWQTVWGEERLITDRHNELTVHLRHESGILMDIVFRCFDDGMAFRYVFPDKDDRSLTVMDETTEYRFAGDHPTWSIPWRTEYYEGIWTKAPLRRLCVRA